MVGTAAKRGIKITKEELKKCIPLCSNCHRDFHFLEKKTGISIKSTYIPCIDEHAHDK
jgi:predicted HNH restriction endonuclease